MPSWIENVAAAVDRLGVEPAGVVWGIAMTDWSSVEERDAFLDAITRKGQ